MTECPFIVYNIISLVIGIYLELLLGALYENIYIAIYMKNSLRIFSIKVNY